MSTLFDQINDGLISKLNTPAPPSGVPNTLDDPMEELGPGTIALFPVLDEVAPLDGPVGPGTVQRRPVPEGIVRRRGTFIVESRGVAAGGTSARKAVDALRAHVEKRLGGAVISPAQEVRVVKTTLTRPPGVAKRHILATTVIEADYQSRADDPEQRV